MSVTEWGLALSFCPWDLNTVHPAIISLVCALLVCHRTVSFPFYSSYLKHHFSAVLGPDHDKSHMHSQTKTKIKVVPAVKNVPVYSPCGVVLSLVCKSVPFTGLFLCELHNVKLLMVFIRERMLGVPSVTPWCGLCCPPGCSPGNTDLTQVLCALPVSADVLDSL